MDSDNSNNSFTEDDNLSVTDTTETTDTMTNVNTSHITVIPTTNFITTTIHTNQDEEDDEDDIYSPSDDEDDVYTHSNNILSSIFTVMSSTVLPQISTVFPQTLDITPTTGTQAMNPNIFGLSGMVPLMPLFNVTENHSEFRRTVSEKVEQYIIEGQNEITNVNQEVLNLIELHFLRNMCYDDTPEDVIAYTIKKCLDPNPFSTKSIIAGIMYYSLSGTNEIFSDYDKVMKYLRTTLTPIVSAQLLQRLLASNMQTGNLDNVKLVVKEEVLDKIPTSSYETVKDDIKKINVICSVCQDDFTNTDKVRILPCDHIYHLNCIDEWLKQHSYKCPCCRKPAAEHFAKV